MHQIQNDVRLIGGGKGVLVETATGGGGQFHGHFRVLEEHGVTAGCGVLLIVRETRGIPLPRRTGIEPDRADGGHQQDVAQTTAAGAAQMSVTETKNG